MNIFGLFSAIQNNNKVIKLKSKFETYSVPNKN